MIFAMTSNTIRLVLKETILVLELVLDPPLTSPCQSPAQQHATEAQPAQVFTQYLICLEVTK